VGQNAARNGDAFSARYALLFLVRAIVIHDQMQGHGRGKLLVQAAEKFQEFLMSVSLITLSYDLALRQFPGQRTAW
jgi:hypothetical protein